MNTVRHTTLKVKFLLSPPPLPFLFSVQYLIEKQKWRPFVVRCIYIYPLSISDLVFYFIFYNGF